MRIVFTVLTLVAFSSLVSACNTMAGAGQDISNGGKDVKAAAERNN